MSFDIKTLYKDLSNLAQVTHREEVWLYFLKDDQLIYENRIEYSYGSDVNEAIEKFGYSKAHKKDKLGVYIDENEILSAAKGCNAKEVLIFHNHFPVNPGFPKGYSFPSGHDPKPAKKVEKLGNTLAIKTRFFIVASPGYYGMPPAIAEYNSKGQVIGRSVSAIGLNPNEIKTSRLF